jgi:hypoxanthine-DNA glycosylase
MSSIPIAVTDRNSRTPAAEASCGFPAVARPDARILILGSLPGQRSIAAQQYYAHPQNAFWPIMAELIGARGSYADRCRRLIDCRIALWDVLESALRPGSLDADIRLPTSSCNDFGRFFATHGHLVRIGFNGRKAAQVFSSRVAEELDCGAFERVVLPSTSPAFASMPYAEKLGHWRDFVGGHGPI